MNFLKKINQLSLEDKKWLLQQLMQQITISNDSDLNPSNSLTNEVKKTFNITPAVPGSGYTDTAINHDQILANTLLSYIHFHRRVRKRSARTIWVQR